MFILDRPKSTEPTHIFAMISTRTGRLKYPVREKILPKDWPLVWMPGTPRRLQPLKSTVTRIERLINLFIDNAKLAGRAVEKEPLRAFLDQQLGRAVKTTDKPFFPSLELILEKMRSGTLLNNLGNRYSTGTIRKLANSINLLKRFDAGLTFANFDLTTYNRFIAWCNSENYTRNYIGIQIVSIKTFFDHAYRLGFHTNKVYQDPDFVKISEDSDDISLTPDQLAQLAAAKIPIKRQQVSRDWFLIGCYCGLRVSDLLALYDAKIINGRIVVMNKKTGESVSLPIHPEVKKILNRNHGFPPRTYDSKLNEDIKAVARKLKWNTKHLFTQTRGGVKVAEYIPLWQMLSSHTARRTFITNAKASGVPDSVVMKLTGIRSLKTLQRYDKLTPDRAADLAAAHPYFKGG